MTEKPRKKAFKHLLLITTVFNFFILSLAGLLLRIDPLASLPLDYRNLLHAHSHFAFGGWVYPAFMWLVMQLLPEACAAIPAHKWKRTVIINIVSAYGMLISFALQGYGAVSIAISTISVLNTFYFAWLLWKPFGQYGLAGRFLKTGLIFLVISAAGPFSTGPIAAMGLKGTPVYFAAIHFYLHFQINGWFTCFLVGLLYKVAEKQGRLQYGSYVLRGIQLSAVCTFLLLFVSTGRGVVNSVAAVAALLQAITVSLMVIDTGLFSKRRWQEPLLLRIAAVFLLMKVAFQLLGAHPAVAALAERERNLLIAFLHIILVGFVSVTVLWFIINSYRNSDRYYLRKIIYAFIAGFILQEVLLVMRAGGLQMNYALLLLIVTCIMCSCTLLIALTVYKLEAVESVSPGSPPSLL